MKNRTILDVARDLCSFHLGDPQGTKLGLAVRAVRNIMDELSLHIPISIRSAAFEISDSLTIQMPVDCQEVLKVGVLGSDNRIRIMGRDQNIRLDVQPANHTCACGSTEATTAEAASECDACCFHGFYSDKYGVGELYGYRPDYFPNGRYRYNAKMNRIEFSSGYDVAAGSEVVVEYRDAMGANDYNLIPAPAVVAITHKAAAMLMTTSKSGAAQLHMNEFRRAWSAYKAGMFPYNELDILAALKGEGMSAPKN